ncbi:hypothetical protein [Rikenella microfusus]|uniref:hypothetical protein n=1 Tax=Rikenella microfusus TaxID=28139 RepID=UPI000E1BE2F5|nr:hypothetical protein [Rikenella microfusus]
MINNKKLVEAIPVVEEVIKMGRPWEPMPWTLRPKPETAAETLPAKGVESVRAQKLDEAIAASRKPRIWRICRAT